MPMVRAANGGTLTITTIGSSNSQAQRTFNVKSILPDKYSELTINNFFLKNVKMRNSGTGSTSYSYGTMPTSYNASTGVLTCSASYDTGSGDIYWVDYTVIAVYS